MDECAIVGGYEGTKAVLYLELNGMRIAKRYPRESWIILEPGWHVHGAEPGAKEGVTVEYRPEEAEPQ